ncbi:SDR family NAD(P)-dependent oxidoreductase [Variovorax sp. PBL-E5]|uniref:SDR family NAD(P)-dependent oxidoreductase n=1 Tax=Variovorax sp. PBL-E5 TaxID=434014 RepID=UPI001315CD83|nr:SDR family oxidoreductase [Variovorax sp. PBL-E5]VTU37511.1 3-oxoacyl-[acyl-carrier-protein] reductase FabG [Variovorax sp. PBL-E5]
MSKAVLVTGGSAGAGFAVAKLMASQGHRVAVTGRSAETGAAAGQVLDALSPGSFFVQGDAVDAAQGAAAVAEAARRLGGLDVLVSAGAQTPLGPLPFEQMTPAQIEEGFRIRVMGRILPVHAAIPFLRQSGHGAVVLLTTDAARHPTPGESVIGASGAAIILLTKSLARELTRDKIRVNAVALTITSNTVGWERMFANPQFGNELFAKAVTRFPSGRAPKAEEVAEAVAFLAGDGAGQITGQTLSVNGGLSFGGW